MSNNRITRLLYAATAIAVLTGAAEAQTATGVGVGISGSRSEATGALFNPRNTNTANPTNTNTANPTNRVSNANTFSPGYNPNVTVNVPNTGTANGSRNADSYNSYQSSAWTFAPTNIPRNAPAIAPPGLGAAGLESCNNSISAGVSLPGGAGALGFPVQDGPCNKRLNARTMWSFGLKEAAIQQLCLDGDMATALEATGKRCLIGPNAQTQQAAYGGQPGYAPASYQSTPGACQHWNLFTGCTDQASIPSSATAQVVSGERSYGDRYEDPKGGQWVAVACEPRQKSMKKAKDGACVVPAP
jgi:hypothetical protein